MSVVFGTGPSVVARTVLVVTACTALAAGSCNPEPGPSGSPSTGFYGDQEVAVGIHFLNHRLERCAGQRPPAHEGLRDVARSHSEDLAGNHAALIDAFPEGDVRRGHIGSDGSMPWDVGGTPGRIRNATQLSRQAENVYWFGGPPRDAVGPAWNFWFNSAGHRANLDDCALTAHGVGVYYDAATNRTYLTHDLGG